MIWYFFCARKVRFTLTDTIRVKKKSFKQLQLHERPREKCYASGSAALSDVELLALMLGSGTSQMPVFSLAEKVLDKVDQEGLAISVDALCTIAGIGRAKATVIVAALEFARRRLRPLGSPVKSAADVYPLLRQYADKRQEHLLALSLNGAHELLAIRVITVGLLNRALVHPREVYAEAIVERAAAIIIAHNHPSGDLTPSKEDMDVTRQLCEAGKLLGIGLLDHLIISSKGYYSFADAGLM